MFGASQDTIDVTVWLAINSEGNVEVSLESSCDALAQMEYLGEAVRVFEVKLKVPRAAPTQISATLPDTNRPVTIKVSE
jgi:hypothetical protein